MHEKHLARQLFSEAVRKGVLVRPNSCSRCSAVSKIQGHHADYSEPLEVEWLCLDCHWARHRKAGNPRRKLNPLNRAFITSIPKYIDEKLREEAKREKRSRQAQLARILEERYGLAPAPEGEVAAA